MLMPLVSWHTILDEAIIEKSENLRYIGMACSLYDDESANVAVDFARERGIGVAGIRDYGDPGVAEFIISELVRLLHGLGEQQWREMPVELTKRRIGIIGMGTTGQLLTECLLPFGAELSYYSRTRKEDWEKRGVKYSELQELLKDSEIISLHLPKKTKILGREEFLSFGSGKILINTSLGLPFEKEHFQEWIKREGNFAIFDADGKKELPREIEALPQVITGKKSAGWSKETKQRLSRKVLENLKKHLYTSQRRNRG